MSKCWESLGSAPVEKRHQNVLDLIEDSFGEVPHVYNSRRGEYALCTNTIENLVIEIEDRSMDIVDIEARNPNRGDGKRMVEALIETAKEFGYELRARNVKPELDAWWREMGFAPPPDEKHSADYIYTGAKSA